jgi:hypothetical protein
MSEIGKTSHGSFRTYYCTSLPVCPTLFPLRTTLFPVRASLLPVRATFLPVRKSLPECNYSQEH